MSAMNFPSPNTKNPVLEAVIQTLKSSSGFALNWKEESDDGGYEYREKSYIEYDDYQDWFDWTDIK